jgi:SAM-dependent methyltransferase
VSERGTGFDPRTIRAAYKAVATDYVATFGDDLAHDEQLDRDRRLLDTLAERATPSGRVLDVGCGPAQVGRYLAARNLDVIGIDLTPAMLGVAREGEPRLAVLAADLRALPVRTGSVAGVTAFYVLQHLPRSALRVALGEFRRVLTRGGLLLVVVHEGEGEFQPTPEITATRYSDDELTAQCERASLRVESVHHRGPLPHEHQGIKCSLLARAE